MAGDKKKEQRSVISTEGTRAKTIGEQFRGNVLEPQLRQFRDLYMGSIPKTMQDYDTTMGGYQDFAKTGGFKGSDLANIRSRALSPTRAVYANANRDVDRQRSLQGGYSPGFGTLKGRMAREQSQGISDASTNAEAAIAQMVQQGRLAGLSGASSLYGTTPGMTSMFGNQVLQSTNQLGNQIGNEYNLGMGLIGANQNAQQLPGKWEGTLGRVGDIAKLATGIAQIPFGSGGGGAEGLIPSGRAPGSGDINSGLYGAPVMRNF